MLKPGARYNVSARLTKVGLDGRIYTSDAVVDHFTFQRAEGKYRVQTLIRT